MTYAVSPNYTDAHLASGSLETEIDVYEDQVSGWLLKPVRLLFGEQHAGFAILSLALTYFEPMGQFLTGQRGKSEPQFTAGLRAVFPSSSSAASPGVFTELYNQLRCGMFHRGITKGKVLIDPNINAPIVVYPEVGDVQLIKVNPWLFIDGIETHHAKYVSSLRDPNEAQLRSRFHEWFSARAA